MTTILTIDDDAHILALYRGILEREGYGIIESSDGDRGIEICRGEPIDLVITDIIMPGKEGLETIMELRQEFPDLGIVAVSGGGRLGPDSYLPLAITMGAQRTLSKPFTRQELLDTVEDLLGSGRSIGPPIS
jgi:DNA-binding NtrC family response regulator